MNIEDLTIKQARELSTLFGGSKPVSTHHPFTGKYVIALCYSAGVHAGEVVSVDGENVILKNSRRLWSWRAKDGVALSGVAQNGLKEKYGKVDSLNPEIYLTVHNVPLAGTFQYGYTGCIGKHVASKIQEIKMLTIKTVFYRGKVEIKTNRAKHANSAVLRAVDHMQLNSYGATVAEVYDEETAELHAVVTHNVAGRISIVFRRDPVAPVCVTNP
jgi:hypothetical protein